MFFYVKSGVENGYEIRFVQSTYFRRKSAFSTEIPLPVKTIGRSRDVSGGTKILRNIYFPIELVWEFVSVTGVRKMFFQRIVIRMP